MVSVGIIAIATVALAGWWYMYIYENVSLPRYSETETVYNVLMTENAAFADGDRLLRNGLPDTAVPKFKEALRYAKDPEQEGQIMFKLAAAIEKSEEFESRLEAVPVFKEIATNPAYTNITRAYAVQQLANMFYTYGDSRLTEEIFKDEPFKSYLDRGNLSLSYRRLFGHSSALYPLALSEFRIADWYANTILKLQALSNGENATTTERIARYKEIMKVKMANGDRDIERIQDNPNENAVVPGALMRKGVVIAKMRQMGDLSFGDMEPVFQRVINLYVLNGISKEDGYTRYYYALYLAKFYGTERVTDIRKLLSKFYETDIYRNTRVAIFFKNEQKNVLHVKEELVLLASLDPKFKAYLMLLGWENADFTERQ